MKGELVCAFGWKSRKKKTEREENESELVLGWTPWHYNEVREKKNSLRILFNNFLSFQILF